MGKTAILFPGQGAQTSGMGKDFYERFEEAKEVFEAAEAATGLDLKELCFTENERLDRTEYTQIAMITTELAIWKAVQKRLPAADVTAGLSLGEMPHWRYRMSWIFPMSSVSSGSAASICRMRIRPVAR